MYSLTCKPTGRFYIGATCRPQQRFKEHMRSPPYRMRGDRKKHPPAEFEMQMMFDTDDRASMYLVEEYFIWKFAARGKAGYNILHARNDPFAV